MDKTIADYADAGAIQNTDQFVVQRSGAYNSMTGANVTAPAAAAQTSANTAQTSANSAQTAANAANKTATVALNTAWAGTNAANEADTWARDAFGIAITGTNTANAALSIAVTALAYTGTTGSAGMFLPIAGGTLTGNLDAPNVQVGYGTVPWSSLNNGTMFYDFASTAYQETTMSGTVPGGNFFISAKNMAPGREMAVLLVQNGQNLNLVYDGNFSFYGATPPSTISNKNILLALTSRNYALSGVIGASSTQQ